MFCNEERFKGSLDCESNPFTMVHLTHGSEIKGYKLNVVCDQIHDLVMAGFPLPSMAAIPLPSVLHIVLRVVKGMTHNPYEGNFSMLGDPPWVSPIL